MISARYQARAVSAVIGTATFLHLAFATALLFGIVQLTAKRSLGLQWASGTTHIWPPIVYVMAGNETAGFVRSNGVLGVIEYEIFNYSSWLRSQPSGEGGQQKSAPRWARQPVQLNGYISVVGYGWPMPDILSTSAHTIDPARPRALELKLQRSVVNSTRRTNLTFYWPGIVVNSICYSISLLTCGAVCGAVCRLWKMRVSISRQRSRLCTQCAYSVANLQTKHCPECGTPFDPT